MNQSAVLYSLCHSFEKSHGDTIFICKNEEDALNNYNLAKFFRSDINVFYFPSWNTIPYDRVSPSKYILAQRARVLSILGRSSAKCIIFTSAANLLQKLPPPELFKNGHIEVSTIAKTHQETITGFLVENGFIRSSIATEPGEFAQRGEIFDVVISEEEAYRLIFSWNELTQIKPLDPLSQTSYGKLDRFEIHPSSEMVISHQTTQHFRGEFLKAFTVNHAENPIYLAMSEGRYIAGCEHLLPLCYPKMVGLWDYLKQARMISFSQTKQAMEEEYASVQDLYQARIDNNRLNPAQFYPALEPDRLYLNVIPAKAGIQLIVTPGEDPGPITTAAEIASNAKVIDPGYFVSQNSGMTAVNFYSESIRSGKPVAGVVKEFLEKNKNKKIFFFSPTQSGIEKIKQLLSIEGIDTNSINLVKLILPQSFATEDSIYLRHQEIIGEKRLTDPQSSNKKLKNILSELETFEEGDLIVHEEHGIGRFISVENIEVLGVRHDCIKLVYEGDDKLYIPVENLDSIKKYGSTEGSLDRLGGVAWQKRKSKLKNRIGELAQKLIAIAAERKIISLEPTYPNEEYSKFCTSFPYTETDDQLTAIADIERDLASNYPMERLICGDVGFGKTEVAMRAAFLVAASSKQVAIVAPTTILCRQHYNNFIERFAGTKLKIAMLSRLTPRQEVPNIRRNLLDGSIDIIIGTHALLAQDIKFQDLGMMIIDEEQHFGVVQKERLKELKHGTHVLSLSATPIPRTLQMSMLGIRDLSLIATPPIDRLSVRTYVIPNDQVIIRDALMREHFRGGRSFYVAPRIKDIEDIEKNLKRLVPELKYVIAHGQMPPTAIDKIMSDFYEGKFDILLCTTIIESGIDIPAANTIVIHKAEMLGLSQLYQLRGRVGRSKVGGYAYLMINNSKTMTNNSSKRLDIMQNIDSLGAGFTIASYDSDIRGFGNLVGDEQSGHIREVGAELYQEMLEQAIGAIQHVKPKEDNAITLNINIPVYIPDEYIEDGQQRLAIYKRISYLSSENEIDSFRDELIDRFGIIPEPTSNLLYLVNIKLLCKRLNISNLDCGPNGMVITFIPGEDTARMVMEFVKKHPRHSKLRPDNKLAILSKFHDKSMLTEVHRMLLEML